MITSLDIFREFCGFCVDRRSSGTG